MSASATSDTPLARRSLQALGGAWTGGVFANLIFAIVEATRATRIPVGLTLFGLGLIAGWFASRDTGPWRAGDPRNGAIGWVIIAAIVAGTITSVALPMPWAGVAGITAFLLTAAFAFDKREPVGASPPPGRTP